MSRLHRVHALATGLLLAVALTACGGSSSGGHDDHAATTPEATVTATSGTPVVTIEGFAFHPSTLVITKGMTVTFEQHDSIPHNVAGRPGAEFIKSPLLKDGDTYSVTFTKAGTFDYICAIHPRMTGKVIVRP
jgi:amicyanin